MPCIEATKESIQQYKDNPGPHMTTIESVISASDLKEFNRLALAAAYAAGNNPYLKCFKTNIHSRFWFYQSISVRLAGLHAINDVLNDPKIKFKDAKDVLNWQRSNLKPRFRTSTLKL